jgi:hypothetical protein
LAKLAQLRALHAEFPSYVASFSFGEIGLEQPEGFGQAW